MRVLVTGATGLVGKELLKQLLENGDEVVFLTTTQDKLNALKGCQGFYWNPKNREIDVNCLTGVETIIHLAGSSINGSWSKMGKQEIVSSRVEASQTLYQLLREQKHQVKQIICASAVGIYDTVDAIQTEENYTPATNFLGQVVQQWEGENRCFEQLGIPVAFLRIGLVLSRQGGALPHIEQMANYYLASPLGRGTQYYSWIHLSDLISIFIFVMNHRLQGAFNAVAPHPETNKQFTKYLSQAVGKNMILPAVPTFVLRLVLGEKAMLVTEGQRISCSKLLALNFQFQFPTLSEAFTDLYKS
ncbi:TIGR01777 family protein [Myroides sp. 1354]|uniref:TIGR01777 family oxidoreductase n=1 Tax=unclassified Myroides TaxID=2642485 RepID=UPI0025759A28|nr:MULTISPECIES: TIGR01777 family oxidoreductase [unclassified Myroides]MDM1045066.1 TIGR01777 family protein [Myroides sp. R163-1]MDM1055948.1 TIGR01777 family protein [Myroides sp. 1354]MDM1069103.1 TIGR01777 family protein [Myroides sp. 1372]